MTRNTDSSKTRTVILPLVVVLLVVAAVGLVILAETSTSVGEASRAPSAEEMDPTPSGQQAETETLLAYNRSIQLTPEQHKVFREALDGLRAPCCDQYSAATCCCECNMARATWGLAKHLVVEKGYDTDGVRTAVADWFADVNPDGFTGDACFTGGCGRSFARNGCGGMREDHLVF